MAEEIPVVQESEAKAPIPIAKPAAPAKAGEPAAFVLLMERLPAALSSVVHEALEGLPIGRINAAAAKADAAIRAEIARIREESAGA